MSETLEKARRQFEAGEFKNACGTLWEVRNQVCSGDTDDAQGLLDLASVIRDRVKGRDREACEGCIRSARSVLTH
jgi:hypothetical protein